MTVPDQRLAADLVTLVQGDTCCVAAPAGWITPDNQSGLYHRDVRVVSRLELRVDGRTPPMLSFHADGPSADRRVHLASARSHPASDAVLVHTRTLARELTERLELHALAGRVVTIALELTVECDFARLPALRHGRGLPPPSLPEPVGDGTYAARREDSAVGITLDPPPQDDAPGRFRWELTACADRPASVTIRYASSFRGATPAGGGPVGDAALRVAGGPVGLRPAVSRGLTDLAALRITAPDLDLVFTGAAAPWFLALFGATRSSRGGRRCRPVPSSPCRRSDALPGTRGAPRIR